MKLIIRFLILTQLCLGGLLHAAATSIDPASQQAAQDRLNKSLLHAINTGDAPAVEQLLKDGADANCISSTIWNKSTSTPLCAALDRAVLNPADTLQIVTSLVNHGARCDIQTTQGTALEVAVRNAQTLGDEIFAQVMRAPGDKNRLTSTGQTPLYSAILLRQLDIARQLIAAGADPDAPCADGGTPLGCAVIWQKSDAVTMLLNAGADANQKDSSGNNLLEATSPDIRSLLLTRGARIGDAQQGGQNLLSNTLKMYSTNPELLEALLQAPDIADVLNATDADGNTCMHNYYYLWIDNPDLAEKLIAAGADIYVQNAAGQSVVKLAQESYHPKVAAIGQKAAQQNPNSHAAQPAQAQQHDPTWDSSWDDFVKDATPKKEEQKPTSRYPQTRNEPWDKQEAQSSQNQPHSNPPQPISMRKLATVAWINGVLFSGLRGHRAYKQASAAVTAENNKLAPEFRITNESTLRTLAINHLCTNHPKLVGCFLISLLAGVADGLHRLTS